MIYRVIAKVMGYVEAADGTAAEKQFCALIDKLDLEDHNIYSSFLGGYVDVEELTDEEWEKRKEAHEDGLAGFYAATGAATE
jgi:hypothetical protein